jgi:N-acylmannosamine kinase
MPSRISNTSDEESVSIAVDFGGTKTAAARIVGGKIAEKIQVHSDATASPQSHVESIEKLIRQLNSGTSASVGVAVSGRIDSLGRWYTMNNDTFSGFEAYPLLEDLQARFGQRVTVMNDAVAAAWGEYNCLRTQDKSGSFLYITVSTGVGGGLILNGRPLVSEQGLAGHFGFMTSRSAADICGSGRTATIESVASGTAIGRSGTVDGAPQLSGKDVYDLYTAGDKGATTIVNRSANAIATAIADVRALLDIQVVSIGGSVGLADGYIEMVRQYLKDEPALFRATVMPAILGSNSALIGVVTPVDEVSPASR